jgi:RNA polymerase sigma-70 factor (ECF subfamily)
VSTLEADLLQHARGGDESAFRRLIEPHRGELHAHCYRMLGSVHDAEDGLQETLLRAWRGLARFEGRSSLRAWLYKIATNACLKQIEKRPKRVLPIDYGPSSDPHDGPGAPLVVSVWIEPYPDAGLEDGYASPDARYERRESVELAFVAALQHLAPRQRAVLILREVLGFSAAEAADSLETTVASVNSALQRARQAVDERLPEQSQQAALRTLGDERLSEIVERYMAAWERGDVDAVVAMLAEDVTVAMPPMTTWFRGAGAAEVFLRDWAFAKRWAGARGSFEAGTRSVRLVPARASGQLAFASYGWDPETETHRPQALQVLAVRDGRLEEIVGFVTPDLFPRFGLPEQL